MHVLILFDAPRPGARADELDGVVQAEAVAAALRELGHEPSLRGVTLDLAALQTQLVSAPPDLVFNLVESLGGHGRLIHLVPSLLDVLGVPYTGADARGIALSTDKRVAKAVLRAADLPTPDERTLAELRAERGPLPGRWILKSVHEHASIGLDEDSVIPGEDPAHMARELERRLESLGGEGFAERFVDGREFNLALLDGGSRGGSPLSLPPAEILFDGYDADKPKVVGWRAKWDESSYEYHHTPRTFDFPARDDALLAELTTLARRAWHAFDLAGWARVDFRVDEVTGRPTILEVNANPCLSPDAGFAAALERGGLDLARALVPILAAATGTQRAAPPEPDAQEPDAGEAVRRPTPEALPLRSAPRPSDSAEVRRIVAATGFFRAPEVEIAVELVREALARGAEASGYHFLFDDAPGGGLRGYACYGPVDGTESSWDFYWIAVDPALQGRGVGQRLLALAESDAAARGARRFWVETSTMALYEPTRRFYHRAGYTDAAALPDFYAAGDGKLVLVKPLSSLPPDGPTPTRE